MNRFKFYIDDTEVTPPKNFDDFTEELVRSESSRHVYFDYPISLEFIGDGYEVLDQKYKEDYNSQLKLVITEQTEQAATVVFNAFIKISNITFDLIRHVATCEIDDTVYQSYLFSNYSVEAGCGSGISKNGVPIDEIQSIDLTVYNPITGVNYEETRRAFDMKDAISMMIAYVSDNTISFESSWYDGLTIGGRLAIVTGFELRNHTGRTAPIISLKSIFEELWKKFNLYLIIENPINGLVVRLEEESYLYGNTGVDILYCENLTRSLDFERLYSTIKIGSKKAIQERSTVFLFPYLRLFSFVEETYNLEGVINVDNTLNLVSEFIIDTNVIQDVLVNDNDDYDEEIFIIQYNLINKVAMKGTYFDTIDSASRLYNESLLNSNVADRFRYLGNLVLQTGEITAGFRATQTINRNFIRDFNNIGDTIQVIPLQTWLFQDDSTPPNFDLQNDYDPATSAFTASDDGEHVFRSRFQINTQGGGNQPPGAPGFDFEIRLYVSRNEDAEYPPILNVTQNYAFGPVETFSLNVDSDTGLSDSFTIPTGVSSTFIDLVQTRNLIAGDEAVIKVNLPVTATNANTVNIGVGSSVYELLVSALSGGTYAVTDPDDYFISLYNATRILTSREQWAVIQNSVSAQVRLSADDGLKRISYPKNISRNFVTGSTEIETVFNRRQPTI